MPATKAQPKEMLPVVDKPAIQYVVEEAVAAGLDMLLVVTGRGKRAIEDHFDRSWELEAALKAAGRFELAASVAAIAGIAELHYVRQSEPRGLGHAVLCARKFIGDEPFALLLADDIVVGEEPAIAQLIRAHEATGATIIGVTRVDPAETSKYGIVELEDSLDGAGSSPGVVRVQRIVEKPPAGHAPSTWAAMGRYVLDPAVFDAIEAYAQSPDEVQITPGLDALARTGRVFALPVQGTRYDIGDRLGYLTATVALALARSDLGPALVPVLRQLLDREERRT